MGRSCSHHQALGRFATATLLMVGSLSWSQTSNEKQHRESVLNLPGSTQVIRLNVMSPPKVRVGDSFNYDVQVSNVSDNLVLHDVTIAQQTADGFQIESAHVQEKQQVNGDGQKKDQDAEQDQYENSGKQNEWTIDRLKPGESRTIKVSAVSDSEGQHPLCLAVTSFTPTLCITTEFVKPNLEMVKVAPEMVDYCKEFEIEYYIKNTGSGASERLTLSDSLGQGLQTASGESDLEFAIDKIEPGDTRKFVARVHATERGIFESRAIVAEKDGAETRSAPVAIEVRQADLLVAIEGPDAVYHGRPVSYMVRVTNAGDSPATDALLQLYLPERAHLANTSDPRDSDRAVKNDSQNRQGSSAENAVRDASDSNNAAGKDNQSPQNNQRSQEDRASRNWELGTLKVGQTKEVRVTLHGREAGEFEMRAVASYACARGDEDAKVSAQDTMIAEVISLPALLLAVVDQEDPIPVGEAVTYSVFVENQGTAADNDVQIKAELPDNVEFIDASGKTEGKLDGQTVTFEPIKTLKAGERANWVVRVKAEEAGEIRFRVELTSRAQNRPAISEEPTRLFDAFDKSGN